jgi:eukaryotic-like serine/threonine-protein kinase
MPKLDPDRWRVVSPHLDEALELTDPERAAWLARLRLRDPALADDVGAMLQERSMASREAFLADAPSLPHPGASLAGQAFGAYTLVSLIGQGGMGNVWLARRSDGRFEGEAAVKLLNANLVGRAGEERFRREGTFLARLADPHIARLLDAGVSASGQPYLVLEYVEGDPIDRFCDDGRLGIDDRLRLFLDVLEAVAHAHANLLVHRDIKPSNVLVDRAGQVKLLDFGIAKLLEGEGEGGAETALTREGGRALTPEFAAPEQLTGGAVTTATDVFALGTLLYILLTGRHPAAGAQSTPASLVRAIVENEPEKLSGAVRTAQADAAGPGADAGALRGTTSDGLSRQLGGDLEVIVAKALKKNPAERYPSVSALADDVRRYLAHEPIRARPDTLRYRARKFVQRNRALVTAASLALLALVGGLVGTISQARRATRDAAIAETQRARADASAKAAQKQRDLALEQVSRANAINDFSGFLLSDAAPFGKPFTAGQLLQRAEEIVDHEGADMQVALLLSIGAQYSRLDLDDRATAVLTRAYELAGQRGDRGARAEAACFLASCVQKSGDSTRAESLIQEGLGLLPAQDPNVALDRFDCLCRASYVAREAGDVQKGIDRILEAQRTLQSSGAISSLAELSVAMDVAESYRMAGQNRRASGAFRDAYARLTALGRGETEQAGTLLNNWALVDDALGRPLEAENLYRQGVRISSHDASGSGISPMLLNNLARTLKDLERLPEAAREAERAYAEARRQGDQIVVNQSLIVRAGIYRELGQLDRAESALDEVEPRLRKALPPGHVAFASVGSERALLTDARGDRKEALAEADRAVAIAEASTQSAIYLPLTLQRRAQIELDLRDWERARNDAARSADLFEKAVGPGVPSNKIGRSYVELGRALQGSGQMDAARNAYARALENLGPSQGIDHPGTREATRLAASLAAR